MQRAEEMSITEVHVTAEAAAVVNTVVMCAIKRFFYARHARKLCYRE